jgi:hypothetical protein
MRNVATGILTRENRDELPPSIVLDNLQTSNVTVLVKAKDTGSVLMDGAFVISLFSLICPVSPSKLALRGKRG